LLSQSSKVNASAALSSLQGMENCFIKSFLSLLFLSSNSWVG